MLEGCAALGGDTALAPHGPCNGYEVGGPGGVGRFTDGFLIAEISEQAMQTGPLKLHLFTVGF